MLGFPIMVADWSIPIEIVKSFLNAISCSLIANFSQTTFLWGARNGMKKY